MSGTAATRSLSSAKMSPHAIKNVAKITQQTERCSNEACAGLRVTVCVCESVAGVYVGVLCDVGSLNNCECELHKKFVMKHSPHLKTIQLVI